MRVFREFPKSALAVFAHPGDAELSCAGTLAMFAANGAETTLVIISKGDKGTGTGTSDEVAAMRRRESQSSATSLGVSSVIFLDRPDGEFENDIKLRNEIVSVMRSSRAECVIAPDPTALIFGDFYINHRDHIVAGQSVLDVVQSAVGNERYFPETGSAFNPTLLMLASSLEANVCVDIEACLDKKIESMHAHGSQVGDDSDIRELVEMRAMDAAKGSSISYAETFRLLELRQ